MNNSKQKIICPEKEEKNLCMFDAIWNALPTAELKLAFSNNNNEQPSQEFVKVVGTTKTAEETAKKGYSERDLQKYLKHLKQANRIKEFKWKRMKAKKATFHTVWNTPPKGTEIFVLFGWCTTGEARQQLIKRIKKAKARENETTKMKEQIRIYHNYNVIKSESTEHAIAIANSEEGLLISDSARKRMYAIEDMTQIAASLVAFHCLYVLDMKL